MALTTSDIITTVFGDRRIVMGKVTTSDTAAYFDTGLSHIDFATVASAGTVGGNSDIQIILNSSDGTVDTHNGYLWVDAGAASASNFIAIGK
jgi:hypothetical protein